jgi:hypothetical protein
MTLTGSGLSWRLGPVFFWFVPAEFDRHDQYGVGQTSERFGMGSYLGDGGSDDPIDVDTARNRYGSHEKPSLIVK